MDLRTVWTTTELASVARCSERTVRRWLQEHHATIVDANVIFARQLPGTSGWLINSQHPAVITFIATPHVKGRPPTNSASKKGTVQ